MGSTEQKTLQSILQAIIDQGNATVTQVNGQIASGTGNLEVVKDLKLQELVGATANHTITLEAKAQELIQLISEQGLRIRINQPSHGFLFNPVQFDTTANKYVKATVTTGADAMAIRVTDDFFDLVSSGSYVIPQGAVDSKGAEFVIDDFYFLDATGAGLIARDEPIRYYQPLFLVYSDRGIKTASINVNPMVDKLAQIVMPDGLNGFQLEEDMRLHTEAKSVVGGINELKSRADGLELEVGQNKSDILSKRIFEKVNAIAISREGGNVAKVGCSSTLGEFLFGGSIDNDLTDILHTYLRLTNDGRIEFTTSNGGSRDTRSVFHTGNCPISQNQDGWVRFPNGLIIQWGYVSGTPLQFGASEYRKIKTVTFPIAFTAQARLACNNYAYVELKSDLATANNYGADLYCVNVMNRTITATPSVQWLAIGY